MLTRLLQTIREQRDAGVTLVELMVGMTLVVMVGAICINFFVGTAAQANRVDQQSLDSVSARSAMIQIAKTLQVADSATSPGSSSGRFVNATPTDLSFYSNFSTASRTGVAAPVTPSLVDFTLTGSVLKESITPPGANAKTSTNTLVYGVTNSTLFSYCSDATDPSVTCTATTNLASIALVKVSLTVQPYPGGAPQTLQTGVAITGALS